MQERKRIDTTDIMCWIPNDVRKCGVNGPKKGILREIIEELEVGKFYQKRGCDKTEHARVASTLSRVINEYKDREYKIEYNEEAMTTTVTRVK